MEHPIEKRSDLAVAQSIVGPLDVALRSLSEAARALGELSETVHRVINVDQIAGKRSGAGIDLARQGGTEFGPAENI
jgi:hypothetical protein